ncbi:MAG: hypothetical protein LBT04_03605 [Prevotellaceae bacterium]|nr:hypothetical protein [Prevotellaceae bacterium]
MAFLLPLRKHSVCSATPISDWLDNQDVMHLTSTLYPPIPISKLCKNGTF